MEDISILRAFLSGTVSVLSPCVLYLIPLYGALLLGASIIKAQQLPDLKPNVFSFGYLAGFSLIFISTIVSSASIMGDAFFYFLDYLRIVGAVLAIVYGIFLVSFRSKGIVSHGRLAVNLVYCGVMVIGMGFSSGWTPCNNATLGPLLISASTPGSVLRGALLLTIYSFGLSMPFALFGIGIVSAFSYLRKNKVLVTLLRVCSGILLILFGLLLVTNNLRQLTPMLPDFRLGF